MRRKNRKFKQDERENSASEKADSSELDNTNEENDNGENNSDSPEPEAKKRKRVSFSKKGSKDKKEKEGKENAQADADNGEIQHEVEAVVDEKMVKGVKHYLIRWKGYSQDDDTWEPEDTLSCPELVKQFYASRKDNTNSKSKKIKEKIKPKGGKKNNVKKRDSKTSEEDEEENWDENEEFEVDRIIEVHHKRDGKREFLVSWKGYPPSQNSWVLEEDMTCNDMIAKFMSKVERAKQTGQKDLRVKPAHTDRFTLSTKETGRRLSKRNSGKQRVQYHDAE